jgi:hypothetical protein
MPAVPPFYTDSTDHSTYQRSVYHDNSLCAYGQQIKPEHQASGTNGRPRCDRCNTLASQGR